MWQTAYELAQRITNNMINIEKMETVGLDEERKAGLEEAKKSFDRLMREISPFIQPRKIPVTTSTAGEWIDSDALNATLDQ